MFCDGPFRKVYLRHGYDPRNDPSSRKYQVLEYRMSPRLVSMHWHPTGNALPADRTLPT